MKIKFVEHAKERMKEVLLLGAEISAKKFFYGKWGE
jgi:hypothetical protein